MAVLGVFGVLVGLASTYFDWPDLWVAAAFVGGAAALWSGVSLRTAASAMTLSTPGPSVAWALTGARACPAGWKMPSAVVP